MTDVDIILTTISIKSKDILTCDQIKKLTLSDKISINNIPILDIVLEDKYIIITLDGIKRFAKYIWYEQHNLDEIIISSFLNKYTHAILEYFGTFRVLNNSIYLITELVNDASYGNLQEIDYDGDEEVIEKLTTLNNIKKFNILEPYLIDPVFIRYLKILEEKFELNHGDIHINQFILTKGGNLIVIDFQSATIRLPNGKIFPYNQSEWDIHISDEVAEFVKDCKELRERGTYKW